MLKIIHGADFHLDSPFSGLTPKRAAQRRERSGKQPRDGRNRAPVKYRNKPVNPTITHAWEPVTREDRHELPDVCYGVQTGITHWRWPDWVL